MPEPVIVLDTSEIREGRLEDVKKAMRDLVDFVQANEPRAIAYHVYLDEEGMRMTVLQAHPDSASMEHHMEAAAPAFRRLTDLVRISTMDIYGTPSAKLLALMTQKARMLGTSAVTVHPRHAGFTRLATNGGDRQRTEAET